MEPVCAKQTPAAAAAAAAAGAAAVYGEVGSSEGVDLESWFCNTFSARGEKGEKTMTNLSALRDLCYSSADRYDDENNYSNFLNCGSFFDEYAIINNLNNKMFMDIVRGRVAAKTYLTLSQLGHHSALNGCCIDDMLFDFVITTLAAHAAVEPLALALYWNETHVCAAVLTMLTFSKR